MKKGTPKVPHFVEVTSLDPKGPTIINIAAILAIWPDDKGCKLLMAGGAFCITESYDEFKKLLGVEGEL
jgi:hypothetical protein